MRDECHLTLPHISVDELIAHIEDDDFFLVYGNPVVVLNHGKPDCVVMSIKYSERMDAIIEKAERMVKEYADHYLQQIRAEKSADELQSKQI